MKHVLCAICLLACVSALAEEDPPESISSVKPNWAANDKPEPVRGRLAKRIMGAAEAWTLSGGGKEYYLIEPLPERLDEFLGLEVEIKGWHGARSNLSLLATQPPQAVVPAWWSLPFILLLACIACMPFVNRHFWEHHYHHVSIFLGAVMAAVYLQALGEYGRHKMIETAMEYFKFIALIGSLYVVTGGILVDVSGRGSPGVNTMLLAVGAVVANIFGTTGASALLIRPFLRINKGRLRPFHVVLFIFIVSNCGGALTPIGDPPLFLGYLYGVPFHWTILHCWKPWLLVVALLLGVFYYLDSTQAPRDAELPDEPARVRVSGAVNFVCLGVVLFGVFLDSLLENCGVAGLEHYPLGAILMLSAAAAAYKLSKPENLARNEFSFGPIREVAYLFVGIFATMVPALDYLTVNAGKLGVTTPGGFYFASGALSSVLDNAPTYLNFLTAAHGLQGIVLSKEHMGRFVESFPQYLVAISLGSVFFGACTYIGNGPNFMVKAIAESAGAHTPGFFGYIVKYTLPILIPIYVLVWLIFLRGAA